MIEYEKFLIENISSLKQPTIFFFLKNNNFSEHYIKNLRTFPNSMKLNGEYVKINQKLKNGDVLEIHKNPNIKTNIHLCEGKLDILFEDDDYLIVNKPHNLSCTPSKSHYCDNLGGQVCHYMNDKQPNFVLRILNRLDRETAGIVVIVKNLLAYNNTNKINKVYMALCNGKLTEKQFTINQPILTKNENGINQLKRVVSENGKKAITHVITEQIYNNYSLIRVTLETGRTHQIRVHLSHIGNSLIGDSIYSENPNETHTFLLLKEISFIHFRTNQKIFIQVDYPLDWKKYL